MKNTIEYVQSGMPGSMSYDEYFKLVNELVEAKKTTGENQSDDLVHYTFLNRHRMNRLNKTTHMTASLQSLIQEVSAPMTWLVLSEAWCGDAAQNLPIINLIAKRNSLVDLRIILRDEHLAIMDEHLTNGGRSIPKLIAFDQHLNIKFTWGPRPAAVQEMVNTYKALPEPKKPYSEFSEEVQKWYAKDKTLALQSEFEQILLNI